MDENIKNIIDFNNFKSKKEIDIEIKELLKGNNLKNILNDSIFNFVSKDRSKYCDRFTYYNNITSIKKNKGEIMNEDENEVNYDL